MNQLIEIWGKERRTEICNILLLVAFQIEDFGASCLAAPWFRVRSKLLRTLSSVRYFYVS
jgi:hypothetical protein